MSNLIVFLLYLFCQSNYKQTIFIMKGVKNSSWEIFEKTASKFSKDSRNNKKSSKVLSLKEQIEKEAKRIEKIKNAPTEEKAETVQFSYAPGSLTYEAFKSM